MATDADTIGRMIAQISLGGTKADFEPPLDAEADQLWDQIAVEVAAIGAVGGAVETVAPDLADLSGLTPEPEQEPGQTAAAGLVAFEAPGQARDSHGRWTKHGGGGGGGDGGGGGGGKTTHPDLAEGLVQDALLDPDTARRVQRTTDGLADRYGPEVQRAALMPLSAPRGATAAMDNRGTLYVDPLLLSDAKLAVNVELGHLAPGDDRVEGVITHEYGHRLLQAPDRAAFVDDARHDAREAAHKAGFTGSEDQIKRDLGDYATWGPDELEAETFVNYHLGGTHRPGWVKAWGDAFDRSYGADTSAKLALTAASPAPSGQPWMTPGFVIPEPDQEQEQATVAAAPHQPRDRRGRWTDTGGGGVAPITAAEARGNSRPVSAEEFHRLAQEGSDRLNVLREHQSPPDGLDRNWDAVRATAYAEVQKSWGGATFDAHTGKTAAPTKGYVLSIKNRSESVTLAEGAKRADFDKAMDTARNRFGEELSMESGHLGVFHDDEQHRIDIDPVIVVGSRHEVETIGAATHAVGGAYSYEDGNGYWPPHVAESVAAAADGPSGGPYRGLGEWYANVRKTQHTSKASQASAADQQGAAGEVASRAAAVTAAPPPGEGEGAMPWHISTDTEGCDGFAVVADDTGKVEGCHDSRAEAEDHLAALYANTPEARASTTSNGGRHSWQLRNDIDPGPDPAEALATADPSLGRYPFTLAFEDQPTLEDPAREFQGGVLTWDDTPFPLKWQEAEAPGHAGAVIVGRVDHVWREGAQLRGVLQFDLDGANGREAHRLVQGRFLKGGSLLADDITDADVEFVYPASNDGLGSGDGGGLVELFGPKPERVVFHSGRIRSWTLVAEPAFAGALVDLGDDMVALAAGVALAKVDESVWDANAAMTACTTAACYRAICAGRKAGPPDERGSWALPHHASAGAPPNANGVRNALSRLPQTQGLTNKEEARRHLEAHLASIQASALVAAAATIQVPDVPPLEWFEPPPAAPPIGGLQVTPEGRVYGYLAPFGIAHRGYDARIEAPRGTVDYGDFMNKPAFAADARGEVVQVAAGNITMACGHAPPRRPDPRVGPEHYDNSCSVAARIRVGEDATGIWVAGALLPDVDAAQVQRMLACELSGDWEPHRERAGWHKFVAAHLVPVGGFPTTQADSGVRVRFKDGQLVASAVPVRLGPAPPHGDELARRRRALADRIAASVGRDAATRRRQLAARVHPSQGGPHA